ncbi:MAG: hypothetical protein JKY01_08345 [Pseudomonadales bacterium]|nr:hypothetical protein [Pseudomonadales bacterium]
MTFLQACTDTIPSADVKTESIVADYRIETFNHKTAHIDAQLHRESHNYEFVILENHDRLIAKTETSSITLNLEDESFQPKYNGEIEIKDSTPITFSFYRNYYPDREQRWYPSDLTAPKVDDTLIEAPYSWVEIPPAFQLLTPMENTAYFHPNDMVMLTWDPIIDNTLMRIRTRPVNCESDVIPASINLVIGDDTGSVNITISDLLDPYITTNAIACDIELLLYREQYGVLDENFSGGSIIGAFAQRVRLHYLPLINP